MKKLLSILLLGAMLVGTLASCGEEDKKDADNTTTAATTTDKGNGNTTTTDGGNDGPVATLPPITTDGSMAPENPIKDADVLAWMENHTCLNDKINVTDGYFSSAVGFFADGGLPNLFDGIATEAEWNAMKTDGRWEENMRTDMVDTNGDGVIGLNEETGANDAWYTIGKFGFNGSTGAFYWSMTEPVKLGSYVIYTGNDNLDYPNRNPVGWYLYATNNAELAARPDDCAAGSFTSTTALKDSEALEAAGWTLLDRVFDSNIADANFTPFGFEIDADKQGEYQYYCWFIDYGREATNLIQCNEMYLYEAE